VPARLSKSAVKNILLFLLFSFTPFFYSVVTFLFSYSIVTFPVVDDKGVESGYYVDMGPVHNAFIGLERSFQNHDGQEASHLAIVKKLLEEVSHSSKFVSLY